MIRRVGNADDRFPSLFFPLQIGRHHADDVGPIPREYDAGIIANALQLTRLIGNPQIFGQFARDVTLLVDAEQIEKILRELLVQDFSPVQVFEQRRHLARRRDIFPAFSGRFQIHHFASQARVREPKRIQQRVHILHSHAVNDDVGRYFQTKKGLRQGDPLSPILFNIVADMLTIMIERAKTDGQIKGVVPHLVDGGLSILQYADDTILFMEHGLDKATNLKLILSAFEQLSGLKINFHKSELFCFGDAQDVGAQYAEIFGCEQGQFPIMYLGIPIHYRKLTNAEWPHVEERLQARLSSWKGKLLSLGGRLVLINSVLTNMVLYMISFFQLPKGVLHKLDYFRSRFF